ncbi:MAG: HAMP domain-containing sensor histidine kinase [Bacteroidota bacterium]
MDIYTKKSRWKFYLALGGMIIVAISLFYTNYLASKLAEEERKKVETWSEAIKRIGEGELNDCDYTLHTKISRSNTTIPVILVDDRDNIIGAANFGESLDTNMVYLVKELEKIKADGSEPIEVDPQYVYFKESYLLKLIRYFPLLQFFLIVAFIVFGYIGFSSARRAEQNQVWVGMAKETAHQLGTPISAIMAWIEHLKMTREGDEPTQEILRELDNDVGRLSLIADRFSKIGSEPTLDRINIYDELEECRAYMQRRAPRKVVFNFPKPDESEALFVNINSHLFDWVIENLLRNALDAMDGKGSISAEVYDDTNSVYIDLSDTGKGIPSSKFNTVFQPGFTTKKRGWGLGLSLAKRIIESYHSGRIFVKKSVVNEGTTFTIELPKGK